jgi:hypothetical protein
MPIRDIPQYKDSSNMAKHFERLGWLPPVLRLFGPRGRSLADSLRQARAAALTIKEMVSMPDRFNRHFLLRGWVASDALKYEAMKGAVEFGDAGDPQAGEELLVREHDSEWLEFQVKRMHAIRAYKPRRALVELALQDHREARFHASIPLVLAQIDGLVYDVARASFYDPKRRERLYAANTMAGHPEGLAALAEILGKPRRKTTSSVLDLPYRHGVLHGRDLGYATLENSTKAFCAFAALREWALPVERGTADLEPPLEWIDPDEATWHDVKSAWRELMEAVRRASATTEP